MVEGEKQASCFFCPFKCDLSPFRTMRLLLHHYNGVATAEGTGFGLQKRTGPSSGVVASIVLVSPGLDCPGVSLAEVCATCLRCHLW